MKAISKANHLPLHAHLVVLQQKDKSKEIHKYTLTHTHTQTHLFKEIVLSVLNCV